MRKNVFGRQFKRDANERKALFKGLMSSLVLSERIKTTEEKAKAIRPQVEKLVTKAKKGGTHVEALLSPHLTKEAMQKMVADIAPRFTNRPGGYTRIVHIRRRFNDDASVVLIEWVEKPSLTTTQIATKDKKSSSRKETLKAEAKTAKPKTAAKKGTAKK